MNTAAEGAASTVTREQLGDVLAALQKQVLTKSEFLEIVSALERDYPGVAKAAVESAAPKPPTYLYEIIRDDLGRISQVIGRPIEGGA